MTKHGKFIDHAHINGEQFPLLHWGLRSHPCIAELVRSYSYKSLSSNRIALLLNLCLSQSEKGFYVSKNGVKCHANLNPSEYKSLPR
jgi:hypothetical protein